MRMLRISLFLAAFSVAPVQAVGVDNFALKPPTLLATGSAADAPSLIPVMEMDRMRIQMLCAIGSGVVGVPVAMLLGTLLGMSSSNLILAALPAVLLYLALPPAAASLAAWMVGDRSQTVEVGWKGAFFASLGVHLLVTTVAVLLGASSRGPLGVVLISVVDGALIGASSVFVMDALATARPAAPKPVDAVAPVSMNPSLNLVAFNF